MKLEGALFALVAIFLIPVTIVYWYASKDPTGTTALILTFGLCFLLGYYLIFTGIRLSRDGQMRPEDNPEGEIIDGAGDLGFFSPHSWWPLAMAAAAATAVLGIIFGWWLLFVAIPFATYAIFGFVFEYYRGEHAH